jgi:putative ABC transport system permease protein
MRSRDFLRLITQSVVSHRLRSSLTASGSASASRPSCCSPSVGEGLNRYIVEQFTHSGTHTLSINPGKTSTFGSLPAC